MESRSLGMMKEAQARKSMLQLIREADELRLESSGLVVSEGAVYMSVFKSIFGKRSFRQSLGISQDEVFDPDPDIHGSCRKTTIGVDGNEWAPNCFVPLWRDVCSLIVQMMGKALSATVALHTSLLGSK